MSTGAQYVVAAYGVVLFGLLMYVVVAGLRSARQAREAELLARLVEGMPDAGRDVADAPQADPVGAPAEGTPPAPRA